MSDWTKQNLRDVEDKAPGFGIGDHWPGEGSRRTSPFEAMRSSCMMTERPPWWPSG